MPNGVRRVPAFGATVSVALNRSPRWAGQDAPDLTQPKGATDVADLVRGCRPDVPFNHVQVGRLRSGYRGQLVKTADAQTVACVNHCGTCLDCVRPVLVCLGSLPIGQFFPKDRAGRACDLLGKRTRAKSFERTLKYAGIRLEDVLASDPVSIGPRWCHRSARVAVWSDSSAEDDEKCDRKGTRFQPQTAPAHCEMLPLRHPNRGTQIGGHRAG